MEFELLEALTPEIRRAVLINSVRRVFRKGETLFHEGDPGNTLHLIEKGRVAIRPCAPDGNAVTLAVLGPGSSFGELALLGEDSLRTATVIALEPVETRAIHRRDVDDLRRREPSIDRFLVDALAAQVRRLSAQVLESLYVPAEDRVVRRLETLAEVYDVGVRPIAIGVRQEDLATMAGTTRSTTNRVLQHLVRGGVIEVRRGLILVDDPATLSGGGRRSALRS